MVEGENKVAKALARNDAWQQTQRAIAKRNYWGGLAIMLTESALIGGGSAGIFLFQNNDFLHNLSIASLATGALTTTAILLRVRHNSKQPETFLPFNINNYRGDEIRGPSDF